MSERRLAALERCMPLHFRTGTAVAGAPIAIRSVDQRTLANSLENAKSVQ
jgi:hypothetical protein